MKNYLAKLVFHIHTESRSTNAQFDEQIRVVNGNNAEEALYTARTIGRKEEDSFISSDNKIINWNFIDVTELISLDELKEGTEIFSITRETSDAKSYINIVKQKALILQSENVMFL